MYKNSHPFLAEPVDDDFREANALLPGKIGEYLPGLMRQADRAMGLDAFQFLFLFPGAIDGVFNLPPMRFIQPFPAPGIEAGGIGLGRAIFLFSDSASCFNQAEPLWILIDLAVDKGYRRILILLPDNVTTPRHYIFTTRFSNDKESCILRYYKLIKKLGNAICPHILALNGVLLF